MILSKLPSFGTPKMLGAFKMLRRFTVLISRNSPVRFMLPQAEF